jgi:hypothetical protein
MKINQSNLIKEKITHLRKTQTLNIALAHQIIDFMFSNPPSIKRNSLIKKVRDDHLSDTDAYQSLLLATFLKDPILKQHPDLLSLSIKPHVQPLDPASYISNPFYQRVKPQPVTQGKWQLGYETYWPLQGVLTGDVITNSANHYLDSTPLGYFVEPFYYLAIKQQDVTWMSVTPFEINTMAPILDKVRGTVITLGLGLGYFASMAALKPEVNEVIVVEKDAQVIQLFLKHIYPHLENKEKINIKHADAFDYVKANTVTFDHLFVDIHHTAEDGLSMYVKMKKIEALSRSGQWHYWLESSILSLFRRYMVIFLQEQQLGFDHHRYQHPRTLEDYLYYGLYETTKNVCIDSLKELDQWLSVASIKSILSTIHLPSTFKD